MIIKIINDAIHHDSFESSVFSIKILVLVSAFGVLSIISTKILMNIIYKVVYDLNTFVTNRLLKTKFAKIESKTEEIFSTLTHDVYHVISNQIDGLPNILISLTISSGCIIYLFFISWSLTLIILVLITLAFIVMLISNRKLKEYAETSRLAYDLVFKKIEGLTYGMKELFQNVEHGNYYIRKELDRAVKKHQQAKIKENINIQLGDKVVQIILLVGISAMVLLIKTTKMIPTEIFTEYLTVTLFMLSPLAGIASFSKRLKPLNASLKHIENLGINLNKAGENEVASAILGKTLKPCQIQLSSVTFSYENQKPDAKIILGPLNLMVPANEIIFIVGGNGSGKTTLAKIIVGLYTPLEGTLKYDGELINDMNLTEYRTHFSAIFNENFVFDDLNYMNFDYDTANQLLRNFDLKDVTRINQKKFTNISLSAGQKKRIALITAILEDKPIYLFDEWAANQDIEFKEIFYREIIPGLKSNGKTVIVISHDEKYYDVADKVMKLEDGKVIEYKLQTV